MQEIDLKTLSPLEAARAKVQKAAATLHKLSADPLTNDLDLRAARHELTMRELTLSRLEEAESKSRERQRIFNSLTDF